MVNAIDERTEEMLNGIVQLRFADEAGAVHDLSAAQLAEVLQGLVEFTGQMARAGLFGDGIPPEVRVRPAQEGSFVLTAVLQWATENAVGIGAITTVVTAPAAALTIAIKTAVRRLRAESADVVPLENGNVKVMWTDGTANELTPEVWKVLSKEHRPRKRALRKLLAPLSDEATRLEIRDGRPDQDIEEVLETEPTVVGDRNDYRAAAVESDDEEESRRTFEVEAMLSSIDFRPGEKWRVRTAHGSRQATIEDDDFLRDLDAGMALHKNDLFSVEVLEVATTRNGRTMREWALTKVTRKRRGGDDGNDPFKLSGGPR